MAVPRGKLSHSIKFDASSFLKFPFSRISDETKILEFEKALASYLGVKYCISFSLARSALHSILSEMRLPRGTKILMPSITIKGILDVVLDLGLKPIFVDSDPSTACFEIKSLKEKISEGPQVALLTYLFGVVPNVNPIVTLLRKNSIYIIEDISQNLNAEYDGEKLGTFGDCAIYSASAIKTLDLYGGGFVFTNDFDLSQALRSRQGKMPWPSKFSIQKKIFISLIRNILTQNLIFSFFTFPLMRLACLNNPNRFVRFVGNRSMRPLKTLPREWFVRFTSYQSVIGFRILHQIRSSDRVRVERAVDIIQKSPFNHVITDANSMPVYWQNIVLISDPLLFIQFMRHKKIDTAQSSLILLCALTEYGLVQKMPGAENIYNKGVYLPNFAKLSKIQVCKISKALQDYSLG